MNKRRWKKKNFRFFDGNDIFDSCAALCAFTNFICLSRMVHTPMIFDVTQHMPMRATVTSLSFLFVFIFIVLLPFYFTICYAVIVVDIVVGGFFARFYANFRIVFACDVWFSSVQFSFPRIHVLSYSRKWHDFGNCHLSAHIVVLYLYECFATLR